MMGRRFDCRSLWRTVSVMALPGLVVPITAAVADEQSGVGIVAEYRPAAARLSISRPPGGDTVPVRIGTVVMAGDRINLRASESIIVQLANGRSSELKGPRTHTIPDSGALGKLASVYAAISGVFDDEYRLEGTAASRGGEQCAAAGEPVKEIEVPILAPGARIVAGERDLPLAWRGGCAPFVGCCSPADRRSSTASRSRAARCGSTTRRSRWGGTRWRHRHGWPAL